MSAKKNFACRACGSTDTAMLLDLGCLPLANAFVTNESDTDDLFRENLALVMCRNCRLIQIRDEVPREKLFSSFLWVTATSETTKNYARWFSARTRDRYRDSVGRFLVEIASNDGYFLEHYRADGFDILGVDPSNLAEEADKRGIPSIRDFFGKAVAERIVTERGPADVIVARNVLGHVSELRDLVAGIKHLLAKNGVCLIESPYAFFLRNEVQYDTIFHEHLSYLTVGSVSNVMSRFGMKLTDVTFVPMNGGSFLFEIVHEDSPRPRRDQTSIDFEDLIGLNKPEGWKDFGEAVTNQRQSLRTLLQDLAAQGKRVVGYGAAAKSMTMLNYCGITPDLLSAMGDANPRKQGLLCPGVRIPVVSPQALMELKPDYILIGAWNFKDEIIRFFKEQMNYRNRFIVPLPAPKVVS
ncbi:MAG TPA: class I SAM-dependent methyltransferase [Terriglobales bacterium]|nr:class I SAM-dependent methyltransferase [Terriglobales bacterium]